MKKYNKFCSRCDNFAECKDKSLFYCKNFKPTEEGDFKHFISTSGMLMNQAFEYPHKYDYDSHKYIDIRVPKNTHSVKIGNNHYCPYCGREMFEREVKNFYGLVVDLHRICFCSGARAEEDFKKECMELKEKYQMQMRILELKYHDLMAKNKEAIKELKMEEFKRELKYDVDDICREIEADVKINL